MGRLFHISVNAFLNELSGQQSRDLQLLIQIYHLKFKLFCNYNFWCENVNTSTNICDMFMGVTMLPKSVNHWWFTDFNTWRFITPR